MLFSILAFANTTKAIYENSLEFLESNTDYSRYIVDEYGILDMPHQYAVKFVKYPGAQGRLETYKKEGDEYVMTNTYITYYRKDRPKDKYGDLKSPGGNVIRYLYRTTNTGMGGWNKEEESFGAYKVSYPMTHDARPSLESGKMSQAQFDKIQAINYINGHLYSHPHSMLGSDIVLHTKIKGSRGCITVPNEPMSRLYHEDLVTENDQEIIPFVTYDEDVIAPPI